MNQPVPEMAAFENDLWSIAQSKFNESEALASEKTAVFVGEKKSGKSSLISMLLNEPVKDEYKATPGLEYKFGRKTVSTKKEIGNIYELGGGRLLQGLLAGPLNRETILNSCVVITLDLSRPGLVLDSLQYWLSCIREHIQGALEELNKSAPDKIARIQEYVQTKWGGVADAKLINPFWIPIVVVNQIRSICQL